jgi:CheY-like chemotaxis protein
VWRTPYRRRPGDIRRQASIIGALRGHLAAALAFSSRSGLPKWDGDALTGDLAYKRFYKLGRLWRQSCPQDENNGMQYKVLIVDDSKLARMVVASAFRRLRPDWELVDAISAEDALDKIAAKSIDIALIDFNMPEVDGLELLAKVRAARPAMPIAIVSANLQDEIIARARELNAAFVPKPLTDEALDAFLSGAALRLKKVAR